MSFKHVIAEFDDGSEMFGAFSEIAAIMYPDLYDTVDEALEAAGRTMRERCMCDPTTWEEVVLEADYGPRGVLWGGTACRRCKVMTAGLDPWPSEYEHF